MRLDGVDGAPESGIGWVARGSYDDVTWVRLSGGMVMHSKVHVRYNGVQRSCEISEVFV